MKGVKKKKNGRTKRKISAKGKVSSRKAFAGTSVYSTNDVFDVSEAALQEKSWLKKTLKRNFLTPEKRPPSSMANNRKSFQVYEDDKTSSPVAGATQATRNGTMKLPALQQRDCFQPLGSPVRRMKRAARFARVNTCVTQSIQIQFHSPDGQVIRRTFACFEGLTKVKDVLSNLRPVVQEYGINPNNIKGLILRDYTLPKQQQDRQNTRMGVLQETLDANNQSRQTLLATNTGETSLLSPDIFLSNMIGREGIFDLAFKTSILPPSRKPMTLTSTSTTHNVPVPIGYVKVQKQNFFDTTRSISDKENLAETETFDESHSNSPSPTNPLSSTLTILNQLCIQDQTKPTTITANEDTDNDGKPPPDGKKIKTKVLCPIDPNTDTNTTSHSTSFPIKPGGGGLKNATTIETYLHEPKRPCGNIVDKPQRTNPIQLRRIVTANPRTE
eukprot:g8.t1